MSWFHWRRRPSAEERLEAELRDHVERLVGDYLARGLGEAEARRRSRLELGGLEQAKEACRDIRPLHWLDELVRDVRLGFRALRRDKPFAVSTTIILALGIGTSLTMFSVLDAVVLRPLPYARPDQLAMLTTHLIVQDRPDGTSMANFLDWRRSSRSFADMTVYRRTAVSVVTYGGIDAPQRAQEGLIGENFFELLGTRPLLGRTVSSQEFERGERVVVLSEGFWRERFAGSGNVLGQTLPVDGTNHVVIGVMPGTFQLPTRDTRFWRPFSILPFWPRVKSIRDSDQFEVLGRLEPGVTLDDARAEMRAIAAGLRDAHAVNTNIDIRLTPLFDHVVGGRTRRGMWLGFAAVMCLLLTACANVGGLLSARAARRRRELAVRVALGAGRARLVRQVLAESLSLWVGASLAGVALAYGLIRLLLAYGPRTLPRIEDVGLNAVSLAVALLAGLVVVIACGLVPAIAAAKTDVTAAFGTRDGSSAPRGRLQDLLVTAQVAAALMLLVAAVLFAQSFLRAQGEDPGYPAENLLIVRIDFPREAYPGPAVSAFFREAATRIGGLPGVVAMGGITDFFIRRNADQWVSVKGQPPGRPEGSPRLAVEAVTPGFFRATGIELLEGRDFEERDYEPGAPGVFIVSESLARRFWPDESAVGKQIVGDDLPPKDGRWDTVVGVVRDIRREGRDVAPILGAFIPAFPRGMDLIVRSSSRVDSLIPAVRHEIRSIDPSLPITRVATADGRLSERLETRRFESHILAAFSAIALLLSGAGLYALLAYQVALRKREIAIRSALGAGRRRIVALILAKGLRLAVAGATVGLIGAAWTARVMQNLLYETPAVNLPSYGAAVAFVLLVASAAAGVPAIRASHVSPMTALREDGP